MKNERLTEKGNCYYDDMERIDDLGGADILYKRLAEYENAKENETLVMLPCNVGDTIYVPWVFDGGSGVSQCKVLNICISEDDITFATNMESDNLDFLDEYYLQCISTYKETWFTDEAEAEERLRGLCK